METISLEIWERALQAVEAELPLDPTEAQAATQRLGALIIQSTAGHPEMAPVHWAAQRLVACVSIRELHGAVARLVNTIRRASCDPKSVDTVLVVDGDAITRRLLEKVLSFPSIRVVEASTAVEARRHLREPPFALVILALVLPDEDGRTLLMELRRNPAWANTPVFILCDQAGGIQRSECMALGADGFFNKPIEPEVLGLEVLVTLQLFKDRLYESRNDPLTGLGNRMALQEAFEAMSAAAERDSSPLSLGIMDLDYFKAINDTRGHLVGDESLIHFSTMIKENLRSVDVMARWGGDEFVVLMPETPLSEAAAVIENYRAKLGEKAEATAGPFTLSAGVVRVNPGETLSDAIVRANQLLYQAKADGKNQVLWKEACSSPAPKVVLLAENDPITASLVRHRVSQAQYEIHHVPGGIEAWEFLQSHPVSLAIMDVQMPGMDGIDLLKKMRQDPRLKLIPVVILTALGNEQDVARAFDAGANDYVVKPFSPLELVKRVQRLLA